MCVNCMAGAMAAGAGASGLRAWLGVRLAGCLTPRRRKILTVGLCGAGVLAAGIIGPAGV
ncbi:MAG: hypothetical protein H0X56_04565 [Solirubrobacterales bacterium]|nr:hypothetical protein [Solirubrobacterales bacterium]MBA3861224.1 hypothetical protein [Solirubrobacterales bacterium]